MEEDKIGAFQFWPNYYKASKSASCPKDFAYAIIEFFYEGKEPKFDNQTDQLLWDLIKPSIRCSKRNSERGRKGGAPVGNNHNPNGRRGKGHAQDSAVDQLEWKDQAQQDETPKPKTTKEIAMVFVPPTQSEVTEYVSQFQIKDPEGFAIYYVENMTNSGWTYGKKNTPVKNWKNNVQQWLKNHKDDDFSYLKSPAKGLRKMVNVDLDKLP